jgi:DivIVA domain-containing protein
MVLLTIAVVAGVVAVAGGLVRGGLEEPASPIPARALPTGPLTGRNVAELRFVQALRGYRMDQVDAAMDQLAAEIDRLQGELAQQKAGAQSADAAAGPARPSSPAPTEQFGSAEPTPLYGNAEPTEPTGSDQTEQFATEPSWARPGERE